MQKGQAALEFLSTYSFVFLVIALVLFIMVFYATIPKASLPFQCTFYGGFHCLDVAYFNAYGSGSQLAVYATDAQVGVVNISSFNAIIDDVPSTSGYCTPNTIVSGQKFYCIANFPGTAAIKTYVGTFSMSAGYCTNSPGDLLNYSCPKSNAYTYGGSFETQGTIEKPPLKMTFAVSTMQSPVSNVLELDGTNYQYGQMPLSIALDPGTGHTIFYRPVVTTSSNTVYVYNSIYGCGITEEATYLVITTICTVTATYKTFSYRSCSQVTNSSNSNLRRISANYCYLVAYNLSKDNINGGNFYGSNLQNVNLDGSNLNGANISYANLNNAQISGANLNYINFQGSNLNGAVLSGSNLNYANLEYADLEGANLVGANLNYANLEYADLQNADLAGANLARANLAYANLQGANLQGTNFNGAYTVGCTGCP